MEKNAALKLSQDHPIVFFDGVCGLCNGVVDGLLKRDSKGRFRFTPLQGKAAEALLDARERAQLETIVVLSRERLFRKSDAVIEILSQLDGAWRLAGALLKILPRAVRDFGYRIVARNRYRVWGMKESCRIPTAAERGRFLD